MIKLLQILANGKELEYSSRSWKNLLFLIVISFSTVSFANSSDFGKTLVAIEKVTERIENVDLEENVPIFSKSNTKESFSFSSNSIDADEFSFFRAAGEISILFGEGYIGIQGNNTNQANGILNLATLGISKIGFLQTDVNGDGLFGDGGTQGNDLAGSIKIFFVDGSVLV